MVQLGLWHWKTDFRESRRPLFVVKALRLAELQWKICHLFAFMIPAGKNEVLPASKLERKQAYFQTYIILGWTLVFPSYSKTSIVLNIYESFPWKEQLYDCSNLTTITVWSNKCLVFSALSFSSQNILNCWWLTNGFVTLAYYQF